MTRWCTRRQRSTALLAASRATTALCVCRRTTGFPAMRIIPGLGPAFVPALAASPAARAADGKIAVVAAENFYGDVARQIRGARGAVAGPLAKPRPAPP